MAFLRRRRTGFGSLKRQSTDSITILPGPRTKLPLPYHWSSRRLSYGTEAEEAAADLRSCFAMAWDLGAPMGIGTRDVWRKTSATAFTR